MTEATQPIKTPPAVQQPPNKPRADDTPRPPARKPELGIQPTQTGYIKTAPSGRPREKMETTPNGEQHAQYISPTGAVQKETVKRPDGTTHSTEYDLGHREKKAEVLQRDGAKEMTDVHYNRYGQERSRETIKVDAKGTPLAKTVVVKNNLAINNTTTIVNNNTTVVNNNTTVVREYRPCRYGYVYAPVVVAPALYVGWYDPYWYTPGGIAIRTHSFGFSWGWNDADWYVYHRAYWEPYPVYVAPSYWVTDWMVAGYLADRYAVSVSVAQSREEVRLAHEEAEKARLAAREAEDAAEIAEAKRVQAEAEARAERAEARAAKAEAEETRRKELAGKPNPNATPIDQGTKEALKDQIEKTIAERKAFAEQSVKGGNLVLPDVSQALADPKHIYPVSKTISVISKDDKPAGTLTAGDLLKLAPGQETALKDASENDFVIMTVMTSKGEEDEVVAGTLIKVSLKDLQEFDNEFRAKLDLGLAEADKNKDQFKSLSQKQ